MMSRDVWWEWFSSLFPSYKSEKIDPYLWTCTHCGYTWKFGWFSLLRMFIFGELIHTCPQCLYKSRYKMITHVVREVDTDKIRENNRWL